MDSLKKISSMHIERLKREEDEEQWISGEELNTEGESDEEGGVDGKCGKFKLNKRKDRTLNHRCHLQIKSKMAASCGHNSPSKTSSPPSPPPALMPPSVSITQDPGSASAEPEPPINISWKPKRGSIKLPNIDLDALGKLGSPVTLSNESTKNSVLNSNLATTSECSELATSTEPTVATTTISDTTNTNTEIVDQGFTSSKLPD
uniref:Uncharacterized protein n=1 Tax=Cacopsylla melanoneura TaxID=428564 RepID=A0A8D9AB34_9HEMI